MRVALLPVVLVPNQPDAVVLLMEGPCALDGFGVPIVILLHQGDDDATIFLSRALSGTGSCCVRAYVCAKCGNASERWA